MDIESSILKLEMGYPLHIRLHSGKLQLQPAGMFDRYLRCCI